MRIDVESTGFRPDFQPQKVSGEINELYNRGESVRGLVVDVNSNMVLIQSSTGRQFSAKTTIPLENYVGQEIAFTVLTSPEGELFLIPEIDEKQSKILDLKIEDILTKFGKQLSPENKEIVEQMIKSGMPVTKESFEEIKALNLALKTIKNDTFNLNLSKEQVNTPIDDLSKSLQILKDFNQEKESENFTLNKNLGLKDIVFLKNIDMTVNLKNLNSVSDVFQNLEKGNTDIVGLNSVIDEIENLSNEKAQENIGNLDKPFENSSKTEINEKNIIDNNLEEFSVKDMETLNKLSKNLLFKNIGEDIFSLIKNSNDSKDVIIKVLKNINNNIQRQINSENTNAKDIQIEYEKIINAIKEFKQTLDKENIIYKKIENDILPKIEILNNLSNKYNFNVVPFILNNKYENVLQFFAKKDSKKKKFLKKDWIVGISINTKNYGEVKSSLTMKTGKRLNIDFIVKDKKVINLIKENEQSLLKSIDNIGFKDIVLNVRKEENNISKRLIDDVIYNNSNIKTFEAWV